MWFIVFPFAIRKTTDRFLFIHTSDLAFFRLAVCQTRLFRLDTRLSTVSDPRNKHVYIWKQNIYAATRLYQHLTLKLNGNWCFRSLLLRTNKRPLSFVINVPSVEYLSMLSRLCSRRWMPVRSTGFLRLGTRTFRLDIRILKLKFSKQMLIVFSFALQNWQ